MRQITRKIVGAFSRGESLKIDNTYTDGTNIWLFGNLIAFRANDGLWICNGGWSSKTTKERLNGLNGVRIQQIRGQWYLNDIAWDGGWVNVPAWDDTLGGTTPIRADWDESAEEVQDYDMTSEWVDEGFSKPIYSVLHSLVEVDLERVEKVLEAEGIPCRRMESDTVGTYRPNYFVIVHPSNFEKAKQCL